MCHHDNQTGKHIGWVGTEGLGYSAHTMTAKGFSINQINSKFGNAHKVLTAANPFAPSIYIYPICYEA